MFSLFKTKILMVLCLYVFTHFCCLFCHFTLFSFFCWSSVCCCKAVFVQIVLYACPLFGCCQYKMTCILESTGVFGFLAAEDFRCCLRVAGKLIFEFNLNLHRFKLLVALRGICTCRTKYRFLSTSSNFLLLVL